MKNIFMMNRKTTFYFEHLDSEACHHGIRIFSRDFKKIFGSRLEQSHQKLNADVIVQFSHEKNMDDEGFIIAFDHENKMIVYVKDDLGFIYALLYISETYFKIQPFWFWMDQHIDTLECVEIPKVTYESVKRFPRYRGWFVNDEDCLIGWTDVYPPPRQVWAIVFETLLRCGGNMVLPGTDLPAEGEQFSFASEMGLWITQHHAAPLNAEMFLRAYPDLEPNYDVHKKHFEKLWEDAIHEFKNDKVVWVLGFRGQGDIPFWENDPNYTTPESRANVILGVIEHQYAMLKKHVDKPICSVFLYQEAMELYNQGHLKLDDKYIKVWSDNGYGKMLKRRHGDGDPRIEALPTVGEKGVHGVYYHLAFHDLEASNHQTMIGLKPEDIADELKKLSDRSNVAYMLINCANIKQHLLGLETLRLIWNDEHIENEQVMKKFAAVYFPNHSDGVYDLLKRYFENIGRYGPYEDSLLGDEYYHHTVRKLVKACIERKAATEEPIAPYLNKNNLSEQITKYKENCEASVNQWGALLRKSMILSEAMDDIETHRFMDNFVVQIAWHYYGCVGAIKCCDGAELLYQGQYIESFMAISESIQAQRTMKQWLDDVQHDHWKNFYRADYLTNVDATLYALRSLRSYIRMIDDGPDLFMWHKYELMPVEERNIYLENTQRQVFEDDELYVKLKEVK